jgi:hypothetical protein
VPNRYTKCWLSRDAGLTDNMACAAQHSKSCCVPWHQHRTGVHKKYALLHTPLTLYELLKVPA